MTKTLPISKVRQDLATLVDNAHKESDEYIITVNGTPQAVLISMSEYESWKDTNEVLADPALLKAISQSEQDIKAGRVSDWDLVKKELQLNV